MANPTHMQSAIIWPAHFLPGTTDNYICNEVIAKDITAAEIWALLADISKWESYYKNCQVVRAPPSGPLLEKGNVFQFATFGFPPLTATVQESIAPGSSSNKNNNNSGSGGTVVTTTTTPGRLAWCCRTEEIEVYHAWLVEDLEGRRVRVLTQESQIGQPFVEMREAKPNVILLGHQDWLEGLVKAARGEEVHKTNLGSVGAWERSERK